jgi:hypothetical protein
MNHGSGSPSFYWNGEGCSRVARCGSICLTFEIDDSNTKKLSGPFGPRLPMIYSQIYMSVCLSVCMYDVWMCMICMYVCMHACMHACMYVCVFVCMICIHIHIEFHIYIHMADCLKDRVPPFDSTDWSSTFLLQIASLVRFDTKSSFLGIGRPNKLVHFAWKL